MHKKKDVLPTPKNFRQERHASRISSYVFVQVYNFGNPWLYALHLYC